MSTKHFKNPNGAAEIINAASKRTQQQRDLEVKQHNVNFIEAHKGIMANWPKTNPGKPLPCHKDSMGKLRWGRRKK